MKRILTLIVILVAIDLIIVTNDSKSFNEKIAFNELKKPKDDTWERIITQVYGRGIAKEKTLLKYKGPILFKLNNAIDKDSLAFNNTLQYFKELLHDQDLDYFSNYTKRHKITKDSIVNGYPIKLLKSYTIEFIITNIDRGSPFTTESMLHVDDKKTFNHFVSLNESAQTKDIAGYINSKTEFSFFSDFVNTKYRAQIFKNVIFKILSAKSFHISANYIGQNVDQSDELVLQKFYMPNFEQKLQTYMYNVYGWRYTNHFLDKENYLKKVLLIVFGIGLVFFILIFSLFQNRKFKYAYLHYLLPIVLITICYFHLVWIYEYFTSFNSFIGWRENIVFGILITIIFSNISAFLMWGIEKVTIKSSMNFSFQLLLKLIVTLAVFNLPFLVYTLIDDREDLIKIYWPIFLLFVFLSLGRGLLIYLNHYSESQLKQKDLEISNLKALQAQAETKLLQSQINPHFLYNSLNSIASLAPTDVNKTQKMAHSLSDLFKYSINRKGKKMSTIKDEIEMVTSYLNIEKIRFGDRLQFDIEVDETLLNHEIPLFLIQPLVENAVKHGVSQNEGEGTISLKIEKEVNKLLISVSDNGPNFPEGLVSGHGLQTVYDLLRLSYGDSAALNWTNTPEKTITITIPKAV